MRKADRILGGLLLLLAVISLGEGLRTWDKMGGTGFMPVIVGSISSLLRFGLLARPPHPEKDQPIFFNHKAGWQRVGLTLLSLA